MITMEQALTANTFYHVKLRNAHGDKLTDEDATPQLSCRRAGKTKTWKTKPGLFRIPVKYGLRTSFYIQNFNDNDHGAPAPGVSTRYQAVNAQDWAIAARWAADRALFAGVAP